MSIPIKDYSLKCLNTFRLESRCEWFLEINSINDLKEIIADRNFKSVPKRILGGGSNLILSEHISALVLKNNLKSLEVITHSADQEYYLVKSASGENWHEFVCWCLEKNIYGLENLSLIPGTVGAAPIQNIGAYGVEVKKFIYQIRGIHLSNGHEKCLLNKDCLFSYRDSIFKTQEYNDFYITEVIFKFPKKNSLEYSYGELPEYFKYQVPTPHLIAKKIIEIRKSKLPNPENLPNVGSFFKNPVIEKTKLELLKKKHPHLIAYPFSNDMWKLSAGQLIELCQFKGVPYGAFSMYQKQALVMVNQGNGSYSHAQELAHKIITAVKQAFEITLEIEPIIWL